MVLEMIPEEGGDEMLLDDTGETEVVAELLRLEDGAALDE